MNKGLINNKQTNFANWYRELVVKGQLIEYYDVKGCYVLLPDGYTVWDNIRNYLDKEFKKRDVENYYFPLFVTKENLQKEEKHLEGFKAEVAWIQNKEKEEDDDSNKEENNIAIRPTSECIICPVMSNMIRSHNDLPKKVNQWANVVRMEFKETVPFIRSKEFLWQEGHTFYSDRNGAEEEVYDIIKLYKSVYQNLLAVPVVMGKKTKSETFAGAEYTYTIEGYIPEAQKGIQCATSHFLGKTFTTMFDVKYFSNKMTNEYCFYNSWGFTTISIGVMVQTHSDNKGLVFPPKIAPIHIVIIPIFKKNNKDKVCNFSKELHKKLSEKFTVKLDLSNGTPGSKYNHWELKGVPLRFEVGEKEIDNNTFTVVRRDTGEKININNLEEVEILLNKMQKEMFDSAYNKMMQKMKYVTNLDELQNISKNNMILCNFCGSENCEEKIKNNYGIKSLCVPDDDKITVLNFNSSNHCIVCDLNTELLCLFSKSY